MWLALVDPQPAETLVCSLAIYHSSVIPHCFAYWAHGSDLKRQRLDFTIARARV